MKTRLSLLIVLLLSTQVFSQINNFRPIAEDDNTNLRYLGSAGKITPIEFDTNIKLFLLINGSVGYQKMNLQLDELERAQVSFSQRAANEFNSSSIIKTGDNDVRIAFINPTKNKVYFGRSSDQGETFTVEEVFNTSPNNLSLFKSSNGNFLLTLIRDSSVETYTSNDDGASWNGPFIIQNYADTLTHAEIIETSNGSLKAVISRIDNGSTSFYSFSSSDDGQTWANEELILAADKLITKFIVLRNTDNQSTIVYNKTLTNNAFNVKQSDIFYLETADGITWNEEQQYTSYLLNDDVLGVGLYQSKPLVISKSSRYDYKVDRIYLSKIGETVDDEPPAIFDVEYKVNTVDKEIPVNVYADDLDGISSITVSTKYKDYQLFDDGNSSDSTAGDNIFGTNLVSLSKLSGTITLADINNLHFPFNNSGIIGGINGNFNIPTNATVTDNSMHSVNFAANISKKIDDFPYVRFNDYINASIVFSGGFYLSGYFSGDAYDKTLWANGVASASLVEDYIPGTVGATESDPSTRIYSVSRDDPDFGNSWQLWKDAVDAGAYFYDGNGDGEYNPIDLNNNGTWDSNEDKPDLLYDATYFSVFNDGLSPHDRRFNTVSPLGIEVRQTVFASSENSLLNNVVFVRYSLLYKGNEFLSDTLNNVIFTLYNDSDIGDFGDDLTGADTTLNSVYTYNNGEDGGGGYLDGFGENPPAAFFTIVQGPRKYTGNQNDIAYNRLGPDLGTKEYAGYINSGMASDFSFHKSTILYGDPDNAIEMRNNAEGKIKDGNYDDACENTFGEVFGNVSCQDVDPKFIFSGDPVTQNGWINTAPNDTRQIMNTGNFNLVKNEPMDIIVAYSAERGTDALNSITKTRQTVRYIHEEYQNNFSTLVGVEENPEELTKSFYLSQNYPNPFNPTTNIKFSIPHSQFSTLKVYDILGREVATLFNEVKTKGTYQVTFDASQFASGVYFYRLTSGDFNQTKKMILLR